MQSSDVADGEAGSKAANLQSQVKCRVVLPSLPVIFFQNV